MTQSLAESLDGHSPDQWALDFLNAARFPPTPENVRAVVSWEYAESGAGGGMFNPLNTTQGGYVNETDFNSVGVKNYANYGSGIAANAKVIHNGFYPDVVAAFTYGQDARLTCDKITRSPWGTGFIRLVGEQPTPPTIVRTEMQLIASPHKPTIATRIAAATWDPANPNIVILTNGASIAHDVPQGGATRSWRPPVTVGAHGVGIMPTIDKKGRPDGRGIVLQDSAGGTFTGEWS